MLKLTGYNEAHLKFGTQKYSLFLINIFFFLFYIILFPFSLHIFIAGGRVIIIIISQKKRSLLDIGLPQESPQ